MFLLARIGSQNKCFCWAESVCLLLHKLCWRNLKRWWWGRPTIIYLLDDFLRNICYQMSENNDLTRCRVFGANIEVDRTWLEQSWQVRVELTRELCLLSWQESLAFWADERVLEDWTMKVCFIQGDLNKSWQISWKLIKSFGKSCWQWKYVWQGDIQNVYLSKRWILCLKNDLIVCGSPGACHWLSRRGKSSKWGAISSRSSMYYMYLMGNRII